MRSYIQHIFVNEQNLALNYIEGYICHKAHKNEIKLSSFSPYFRLFSFLFPTFLLKALNPYKHFYR